MFPRTLGFVLAYLILFSCRTNTDNRAESLVRSSIQAHGGHDAWEDLEMLSFRKETEVFREDGSLESGLGQEIEIRLKPFHEVKMSWVKEGLNHLLHFDGTETRYRLGENDIQNLDFLNSKKADLDAAFYVMTKPFDLLEGSKRLNYLGVSVLPDGKTYETIEVTDGNQSSERHLDIWKYYFDPDDFRLAAYSVKTSNHESLVYNMDLEFVEGILLPQGRESYRLHSEGNIHFKRASYRFSAYSLKK